MEAFFALPHLARLGEREYRRTLGLLRTGIPYRLFQRNVALAVDRLPQSDDQNQCGGEQLPHTRSPG